MSIRAGSHVQLEYELRDEDGQLVECSAESGPMEYVHGEGEMPPALEQALEGQGVGFEVNLTLPPDQAYGEYDVERLLTVPRSRFPEDAELVAGSWVELELEAEDGEDVDLDEPLEVRVVEANADGVVLDANHPLAGVSVMFQLRVLAID